jgi:hypothetical protein
MDYLSTLRPQGAAYDIGAYEFISGDTTDPTGVAITDPNDQDTISGTQIISATAQDETGMDRVEFYRDGSTLLCTDDEGPEPWTCSWDTTQVADGDYDLTVVAYDTSQNSTASVAITVTVDNVTELTFPGAPTGLSSSSGGTLTFPGVPTALSSSSGGTPTMPGAPTALSSSSGGTPTFPGNPTGLSSP